MTRRFGRGAILVCAFVLGRVSAGAFAQATFQGIGDLAGGNFFSAATAVSANGSIVVGMTAGPSGTTHAFRWTGQRGLQSLGHLPGPAIYSEANGISADGTVIVGASDFGTAGSGRMAMRWTAATGMTPLDLLPPGDSNQQRSGYALATSADGSISAGSCDVRFVGIGEHHVGTRWTSRTTPTALATVPTGLWMMNGIDISADGQVAVGDGAPDGPNFDHAFIWTASGGGQALQWVPGQQAYFTGVSANGLVAVGMATNPAHAPVFQQAVRWTSAGGFQGLGVLPGATSSYANGVSSDGSVIVGVSAFKAFIWTAADGIRNLRDVLTTDHGLNLTGWQLSDARAVSDDGQTIVGVGTNPTGQTEAWVAKIPRDRDGDGLFDSWETDGIPYTDSFGATQLYVLDINGDGLADCNPQHKDLFIEVDSMAGLAPSSAVFSRVISAFAAAPVTNPDGVNGVKLHIKADEGTIPIAGWTVDDTNANGVVDWPTEFDALKLTASSGTTLAGYFGTSVERNDPDAAGIRTAKAKAYRYCIFAKEQDPGDSTSGRAEGPGNDFIVSLGLWSAPGGGGGGTTDQQTGTFMHELGHTLGLGHGGRAPDGTPDHVNFKPNYYSIMSYNWQMPHGWMTPGSWPLAGTRAGYSTFAIPTILNEAAADDCLPAMVTPGSALAGVRYPHNTHADAGTAPVIVYGRFDAASDWNNDEIDQCGSDSVAVDLTRVRSTHDRSPGETLLGRNDWSVLVYGITDLPTFVPGVHVTGLGDTVDDLDLAEHLALSAMLPAYCGGDINDDRSVNVTDLLTVIGAWGACPPPGGCLADIAPFPADGQVNVTDLLAVISAWGPCP